jgi:hypothetical protein
VSYPGVYIEEIPSGVRTIVGVPTSIAAFIGRALRGPTNKAVVINGFGDFERIYGGLWRDSSLGYAVRDFFLNGGGQAIIVRLYKAGTTAAKATFSVSNLNFEAANEGAWGANLVAILDTNVSAVVAAQMGVAVGDLFNLTFKDTAPGGASEEIRNVTVIDSSRRIDKVLELESNLARWHGSLPSTTPTLTPGTSPAATGGSNGDPLTVTEFELTSGMASKHGLFALEQADLFNLLCIPPYLASGDIDTSLVTAAATYCETRRAMFLIDPPSSWVSKDAAKGNGSTTGVAALGTNSKNSAVFFPRLLEFDPLQGNRLEKFVPCGAVAGVFARTDTQRGVWKAPAGQDATLNGVPELSVPLTDAENGELNPLGINCLRVKPAVGRVVWGARTLQGNNILASEWKYIPVRRTALFIEESLYRGTQWVVFEPNDEPLWAQIRLNVGAFMQNLFRQGAFQGQTPRDAYLVKCDKETTTQNDINLGIVNIVVGFAPLKPAEFVIIKIQQLAGQIQT